MGKPKIRIGDICEVKTQAGLAYVQYTHDGEGMGQLVRVLPGLYSSRPPDIAGLAKQKELYFVFFTLEYALKEKDKFSIISNQPLPDFAKQLPMMRKHGQTDRNGNTLFWYIGGARKMSTPAELQQALKVTKLTPEQEKLSIEMLWPPPVMIKELARGWLPERDEEFNLEARGKKDAAKQTSVTASQEAGRRIEHYFYFPRKQQADEAAELIREKGLRVTVRKSADGESWLALATSESPEKDFEIEELREEFERLADHLGGEYDGWAMRVQQNQRVQ